MASVSISANVEQLRGFAADLSGLPDKAQAEARKVTRTNAMRLLTRIRANASGRPGPRVITGNYRRSWNIIEVVQDGVFGDSVGTSAPQGRRLEMGFVAIDSIGRHYNQSPYPHVLPAIQDTIPEWQADLEGVVERAMAK